MPDRGTGKTYRRLLFSLREASYGGNVLYVCRTYASTRKTVAKALKLSSIVHAHLDRDKIVFPNGGRVCFYAAPVLISSRHLLDGVDWDHLEFDDLNFEMAVRFHTICRTVEGRKVWRISIT